MNESVELIGREEMDRLKLDLYYTLVALKDIGDNIGGYLRKEQKEVLNRLERETRGLRK